MAKDTNLIIGRTIRLLSQQGVAQVQGPYGNALREYLLACAELSNLLDDFYKEDFSGKAPLLREGDIPALRERYLAVFRTAQAVKDAAAAAQIAALPAVKSNIGLMDTLGAAIGPELAALSGGLSRVNVTLPELLDQARGYEVDISGAELTRVGGKLSNRIPVTFTDRDGTVRRGFFTESTASTFEAEYAELLRTTAGDNAEYREFFESLTKNEKFSMIISSPTVIRQVEDSIINRRNVGAGLRTYMKVCTPDENGEAFKQTLKQLTQSDDFNLKFLAFLRGMNSLSNRYKVFEDCGITRNDRIEERNAAMSAVADLLGVEHLLARSTKMVLNNGDKKMSGVFMEYAPGSDFQNLGENDPMLRAAQADLDTPQARKSLADLQVLDYLCANTDRHPGNMFYQFDADGKMVGVVGIDNDCAFGALNTGGTMRMVTFDTMKVISRSMADRICALTPDMLDVMLRNITLSPAERESARVRLAGLQDAIARGREHYRGRDDAVLDKDSLRIVEDDEWERFDFRTLGRVEGINYFGRAENLADSVQTMPKLRQMEQTRAERLRAINPALAPEASSAQSVQGVRLRSLDDRGLASVRRELSALDAELREVNSGAFIGSKEFDEVIRVYKYARALTENLRGDSGNWDLRRLNASYQLLEEKLRAYTDKKAKEARALADKGKQPSERAKLRFAFAEKLRNFSESRRFGLTEELRRRTYREESVDAILAEDALPECGRVREALAAYRSGDREALAQVIAEGVGSDRVLRSAAPDAPNRFRALELYSGLMDLARADPALRSAVSTRLPSLPTVLQKMHRAMEVRTIARWSDDSLEKLRSASAGGQPLAEHEKRMCLNNILAAGVTEALLSRSMDIVEKPNALRNAIAAYQKQVGGLTPKSLMSKGTAELCRMLDTSEGRIEVVRGLDRSLAPTEAEKYAAAEEWFDKMLTELGKFGVNASNRLSLALVKEIVNNDFRGLQDALDNAQGREATLRAVDAVDGITGRVFMEEGHQGPYYGDNLPEYLHSHMRSPAGFTREEKLRLHELAKENRLILDLPVPGPMHRYDFAFIRATPGNGCAVTEVPKVIETIRTGRDYTEAERKRIREAGFEVNGFAENYGNRANQLYHLREDQINEKLTEIARMKRSERGPHYRTRVWQDGERPMLIDAVHHPDWFATKEQRERHSPFYRAYVIPAFDQTPEEKKLFGERAARGDTLYNIERGLRNKFGAETNAQIPFERVTRGDGTPFGKGPDFDTMNAICAATKRSDPIVIDGVPFFYHPGTEAFHRMLPPQTIRELLSVVTEVIESGTACVERYHEPHLTAAMKDAKEKVNDYRLKGFGLTLGGVESVANSLYGVCRKQVKALNGKDSLSDPQKALIAFSGKLERLLSGLKNKVTDARSLRALTDGPAKAAKAPENGPRLPV